MSDIAASGDVTPSSASVLVERLVEKGLVIREPDTTDRRVVRCRLSEQGKEYTERFWRLGKERIAAVIQPLTDEELGTIARALELVLKVAQQSCPASVQEVKLGQHAKE